MLAPLACDRNPKLPSPKWIVLNNVTEVIETMWFHSTHTRPYAWVLGLSVLLAASSRSQAQDVIYPEVQVDPGQHHPLHHGWGFFHSRPPAIPRTYSYYYDRWFNRPRHFRVVGQDGKIYWRTTVRDLPMGTPWPEYGAIETQ